MPRKYTLKEYVADYHYHVFNRGVNKRPIFLDDQDYGVFLGYLKSYLLPVDKEKLTEILVNPKSSYGEKNKAQQALTRNNFCDEIQLMAYVLMINHFHFILKQKDAISMQKFMRSLMTRYSIYFKERHRWSGPIFESAYKAIAVLTDEQLWHLTRYIHRNPLGGRSFSKQQVELMRTLLKSQPSSYPVYLNETEQKWVKPELVLSNFSESGFNSYRDFVEETDSDHEAAEQEIIDKLTIDLNQESPV